MYYSNGSKVKTEVESWYQTNIVDNGYDSYVATTMFCEEAKVRQSTEYTPGNASMAIYNEYTPTFKCANDGNGKGPLSLKVGLITYDEVVFAGGYYYKNNTYYYLYSDDASYSFWTMSPAGKGTSTPYVWGVVTSHILYHDYIKGDAYSLRPVINLNANVLATGTGTKTDPYVVQTN